ncbi:alpha/beta fold hydrolase [Egbenema bharatensis]|uniref:alpha/beta fold hydrolase n=1 Tax=Egbenema bharatensis TaxID=3463334 RepID=UPI003A874792
MAKSPDILWLNVNPGLQCFDRPLLHYLTEHRRVEQWQYRQSPDESSSFEAVLTLLHDDIQRSDAPLHLIGHGTSGLLGLLYAQRHPERVRSLTLLSVGIESAIDWKTHYYNYRRRVPYSRQKVLHQMIGDLFGDTPLSIARELTDLLEQDLDQSLSLHHLFKQVDLPRIPVTVPLLVCSSVDDVILDPNHLRDWQSHFSDSHSRLWICSGGRHFFHYFYSQQVGEEMLSFWRSMSPESNLYPISDLLKASA